MTNRIDLTKYEGITQGEWGWIAGPYVCDSKLNTIAICNDAPNEIRDCMKSNAQLIADAPALVEELRRCYAVMDDLNQIILEGSGIDYSDYQLYKEKADG